MDLHRSAIRHADHIAVVSESTRRDVVTLLGADEKRVTNTYQSVDLPFALTSASDEQVARDLDGVMALGWKGYFLHFGAIEPKKNLGRLGEAFLGADVAAPLIVVGGAGWLQDGELAVIEQARLSNGNARDRIRILKFASPMMIVNLIRGAKAVLFPSLYEGFGLPALEAMLLGTPVLASDKGGLGEVVGDAALTVDPYDIRAIQRGIVSLDHDEALRDDLIVRGRAQAKRFSPEAYQHRLRGLYDAVGT